MPGFGNALGGFAKTFNPVGALKYSQKAASMVQNQAIADAKAAKTEQFRIDQLKQKKQYDYAQGAFGLMKDQKMRVGKQQVALEMSQDPLIRGTGWQRMFEFVGREDTPMSEEDMTALEEAMRSMSDAQKKGDATMESVHYRSALRVIKQYPQLADEMASIVHAKNKASGTADKYWEEADIRKRTKDKNESLKASYDQWLQSDNKSPRSYAAAANIQMDLGNTAQANILFGQANVKAGIVPASPKKEGEKSLKVRVAEKEALSSAGTRGRLRAIQESINKANLSEEQKEKVRALKDQLDLNQITVEEYERGVANITNTPTEDNPMGLLKKP